MNRILITTFTIAMLAASSVEAQSWMFQPGTYTKQAYGPAAPSATPKAHAYATFTESQAAQAAQLPKPAFQWDPTGVLGRGYRDEMWSHQEAMEANRLRTYAQGVRDAVGAPLWSWNPGPAQPLPQIVAPTEESSGKAKPRVRP